MNEVAGIKARVFRLEDDVKKLKNKVDKNYIVSQANLRDKISYDDAKRLAIKYALVLG
jgi:hypothetical protein